MVAVHATCEVGLEVRGQKQSSSDFAHYPRDVRGKFRQNPFHIEHESLCIALRVEQAVP
jgi:hypothetical protein